jgi:uncharacterized protein (DUF1697 family)
MDQLRRMFEALGFANVETFIASGNVIFASPSKSAKALEKKIEKHLYESLGYEVATFVRTTAELAEIAQYQPFNATELNDKGKKLYIAFTADSPSAATKKKLLASATETDEFHIHGREVYWLCRTQFHESKFSGALLEKILGVPATVRNATTVRKMAAKYVAK